MKAAGKFSFQAKDLEKSRLSAFSNDLNSQALIKQEPKQNEH